MNTAPPSSSPQFHAYLSPPSHAPNKRAAKREDRKRKKQVEEKATRLPARAACGPAAASISIISSPKSDGNTSTDSSRALPGQKDPHSTMRSLALMWSQSQLVTARRLEVSSETGTASPREGLSKPSLPAAVPGGRIEICETKAISVRCFYFDWEGGVGVGRAARGMRAVEETPRW